MFKKSKNVNVVNRASQQHIQNLHVNEILSQKGFQMGFQLLRHPQPFPPLPPRYYFWIRPCLENCILCVHVVLYAIFVTVCFRRKHILELYCYSVAVSWVYIFIFVWYIIPFSYNRQAQRSQSQYIPILYRESAHIYLASGFDWQLFTNFRLCWWA